MVRMQQQRPRGRTRRFRPDPSAVADALLHLKTSVVALSDSELAQLPLVQRQAQGRQSYWAEGIVLQEVLTAIVENVLLRLPSGDRRADDIRATLEGVLAGLPIAAIARARGRTREHWSRGVWRQTVQLVAAELARLEREAGSGPTP